MTPLSTALLEHLLAEREVLDALIAAIDGDEVSAELRARARQALAAARRREVWFGSPSPGVYVIDGRRVESELVGLRAAWLAFDARGVRTVRAGDLVAPGVRNADGIVRKSVKRAAALLEGCDPALAAEVRGMRVVRGLVQYVPRPQRRVEVLTRAQVLSRSAATPIGPRGPSIAPWPPNRP